MKASFPVLLSGVGLSMQRLLAAVLDKPGGPSLVRSAAASLAGLVLCKLFGLNLHKWTVLAVVFLALSLTTKFLEYLYVFFATLKRDLSGLILLIRLKWSMYRFVKNSTTIPKTFKACVRKHPEKPCYIFEDQVWTFRQVDERSNAIANVFWEAGFRHGDIVALFMESRPEFVCTWLGLAKIGVVTSLINFNLRSQPLVHSITTASARAVIFGTELKDAVSEILSTLPSDMIYYHSGKAEDVTFPSQPLDSLAASTSKCDPPKVDLKPTDRMIYIYTSGTTGLPKAAVITNIRFYFMAHGAHLSMQHKLDDIFYDPLPLYHSAGGVLGIGQSLIHGNTVFIRKKFSASNFWADCIKHNCTVTQYIGEICRYLLAQPNKPEDRAHKIRTVFGNGMRPQIWQAFVDRFGVKKVVELYGATEGNANIVNTDNTVGAVGFLSRIAPFAYPCWLIKINEATGEILRDHKGMAIHCNPGEPGEFVGKILSNQPERSFDGYVSKTANQKKVIRDVWKKGDMAFSSGDILVMDQFGYLYFKDRTGDTFRWKGENVSTAEVEAVISNAIGLKDCTVYGVQVPGQEGRAGMAAILDSNDTVKMDILASSLQKSLPPYARPLFIRITDSLPMTGTYKLKKVEIQEEGFNPSKCGKAKLYYLDRNQYKVLDAKVHEHIVSGKIKL